MGETVNLRQARKAKARAAAKGKAAAARAKFGQSRAEREAADMIRALEERRLNAHRREFSAADERNG
ncbi:MAG TPA: DUF4169 family protein [Methylocella sp.]|nr:DUF4169 family protein [Methylocella sp.]